MRDRGRKKQEENGGGGDWALSYGDMMTLLMVFFVLIVSFSTTELIKFRQAMGSLKGSMGAMLELDGRAALKKEMQSSMAATDQDILMRILKEIEKRVFEMDDQTSFDIEVGQKGVNFRIGSELLFDLGSADLKSDVERILDVIGKIIQMFTCEVRVEGHTDNLPIRTNQFPSNWELSSARAASVVRYFVNGLKNDPTRFMAVGCGEHRPLLPNLTEVQRKQNRRVEISLNWGDFTETVNYEIK